MSTIFLLDNNSQVFDCDFHEMKTSIIRCAGVEPIDPVSIGGNDIVTKSILQNSQALGIPANVVLML
jgi:hypothetical protein